MSEQENKISSQESGAKKPEKKPEPKPGFFTRMGRSLSKWFRDLRSEVKKVVWPTGKQVVNNTVVVIIAVIVVCAFVALLDGFFGLVRDTIVKLV